MKPVFKLSFALILCALFVSGCQSGDSSEPGNHTTTSIQVTEIASPAQSESRYPNLYTDNTGTVYLSWTRVVSDTVFIEYASFNGGAFSEVAHIHTGHPDNFFVNWADFPSVVGHNGNPLAAHWLGKVDGGTFAYHVDVSLNTDDSGWAEAFTAHLDHSPTEHGFVSLEPISDDTVLAIWLDGRYTDGGHGSEDFAHSMTLRSAELSPGGIVNRKNEIDDTVCDCCQTDLVPVGDDFFAVYRNRSEGEIRDIAFSRYTTETGEWSTPETLHADGWEIHGCPVNGPRAASHYENVAIIWYTQADDKPQVKLTVSSDAGFSFSNAITLETVNPAGRTDVVYTNDGRLFVSWLDLIDGEGHIMLQEITNGAEGGNGPAVQVAVTSATPRSGFPRMTKTDNGILFAWTATEPAMQVKTALVNID